MSIAVFKGVEASAAASLARSSLVWSMSVMPFRSRRKFQLTPTHPPPPRAPQDAPPRNRSSVTHALDSPNLIADDQPKGPASTHSTQPPEPIHEFARPAIL